MTIGEEQPGRVGALTAGWRFRFALVCFATLSLVYTGYGLTLLFTGNSELPDDFSERWREQRYVLLGKNPYDLLFSGQQRAGRSAPPVEFRQTADDARIGGVLYVGYPPWTYLTGMLLHSLPAGLARLQFALVNLLSLGLIGIWLLKAVPVPLQGLDKWILPLMVLGTMPFWCTLGYGQYGVILVAMLVWSLTLSDSGRSVAAGVLFGMVMLKPSFCIPFGLLLVYRRDWRAIGVAVSYVVAGGLLVCKMTRTAPLTFMLQMREDMNRYVLDMPGVLKAVVATGVPLSIALPGLILLFLLLTWCWIVWMGERAGLLDHLAIAGLAARLCTYHRPYDDLLLAFLLLAVTVRWLTRPSRALASALLAVGLSLWLPLGFGWKWPFALMQHFCWVYGAIVLTMDIVAGPKMACIRETHRRNGLRNPGASALEHRLAVDVGS